MKKTITLSQKIYESFETMTVSRIGIIGGGPATVSFCLQLMEQLKSNFLKMPLEIFVFEKNNKIGPGLPYSQKEPAYIVNLPKKDMEPIFNRKREFSSWLEIHYPHVHTKFPPRYMFGEYLQHLAKKFQIDASNHGIKVKYFTDTAISNIKQLEDKKFSIQSKQGEWKTDYVILATGCMPSDSYSEYKGILGYRHSSWDDEFFSNLKGNETIGIIGTRLTAIDAAVRLLRKKHEGRIIMGSRTGLLPTVLANEIPSYSLKYFQLDAFSKEKRLKLERIVDLFFKEISLAKGKHCDFNSITKSYRDITPLEWMNREIYDATEGSKLWQHILFEIYPKIPYLWLRMSLSDQKKFMVKYYSTFMTYLAAFPLKNAYKIKNLLQSGQLTVLGDLKLHCRNGHYSLENNYECIKTQYLLNATGPGYNIAYQPLYKKMLEQGLIQQHSLGGLNLNAGVLQVLNKQGRQIKGLFAVGELTKGKFLATTDMQRVAQQTNQIATFIIQTIRACSTFEHGRINKRNFYFFSNPIQKKEFHNLAIHSISNNIARERKIV